MKETFEVFYEIVGVNSDTGQSTTRLVWLLVEEYEGP